MAEQATGYSESDEESKALQGYKDIPEEERRKAVRFFEHAKKTADTGNYDYSIEMYIQGLTVDPEAVEYHQALRDVSLKRKANGGKAMGMFERSKKLPKGKDDKSAMLNAEMLLAYDPGNTDYMVTFLQAAHKAGFYDTVMWLGPILLRANLESGKPDIKKFLILKDIYKSIERFDRAVEAMKFAEQMRPNDMEYQQEAKNLAAWDTMQKGKYSGSFRDSIRNMAKQQELLRGDADHRSVDTLTRTVLETEREYLADPNDIVKLRKYVNALEATEQPDNENKAIEALDAAYQQTKQFSLRQKMGAIQIKQLARMERSLKTEYQQNPTDAELKNELIKFQREKAEKELAEFRLWSENYPTDTKIRFDVATRLFQLGRFDEAIPTFQQVRSDPKFRIEAAIYLGRSFLESQFLDEAVETLQGVIEEYAIQDDEKARLMHYWLGRALEQRGDTPAAIKEYSRVAQVEFTYKDVQQRIRALRAASIPGGAGAAPGGSAPAR